MSAMALPMHTPVLAWSVSAEDERRFKRILRIVLLVTLLFALIMPWMPVREPDRTVVQPLPPQLAKILLDKEPPPPPKVERKDEAKPAVPQPDLTKPAPKQPIVEARKPEPNKAPGERLDNARARASGVGLLAMKNELQELHSAPAAVQLKEVKPGAGVGTGTGPGVGAGLDPGVPTRALITSNATGGSGGLNTAGYSRDTGGGGLAGRSTTLVEGVAGGRGGGGAGASAAGGGPGGTGGARAGGQLTRGTSGKASRSIEEIKLVFERNKGAIYAIYNRALREEPSLQGKVVLELKIAPSGAVTDLRVVSSELKSPDLERKLLARIKQFDFGAKDVDAMTVTWPVDFLPS